MEIVGNKFKSFQEAEEAELNYYRSLTPQQRLDLLLDIINSNTPENAKRVERVCKIVKLHEN